MIAEQASNSNSAVRCSDACGNVAADETDAAAKGWTRLQITGRIRCSACVRQLAAVNAPKASQEAETA